MKKVQITFDAISKTVTAIKEQNDGTIKAIYKVHTDSKGIHGYSLNEAVVTTNGKTYYGAQRCNKWQWVADGETVSDGEAKRVTAMVMSRSVKNITPIDKVVKAKMIIG